jgi:putative tricarboxylic transport membrane protein
VDALGNLLLGFSVALTPINLFWCLTGVILGTTVGVLPGLGPAATIAMLLPLTLKMDHTTAIIALAGIFYGARYGGSTTSILLNIPGESSSVVTCLDGYQLARQGRAGAALGISAISSFIAGTIGVFGLMLVAPPLARFALRFAPPEYFALMVLGLAMVVFLAGESMVKALLAMLVGLWISTIGTDLFTAESRFTFGQMKLLGGVDFIAATVGIFALGEVLVNLESRGGAEIFKLAKGLKNLLPTFRDLKDCRFAFLNGSIVGFLVGALPGAGATVASFLSYGLEKAFSRHPQKFGTGVIEGVAAPEAANNADAGGALVPLLTLGIPGGNTTAILLGGLILWGYKPGPLLIQEHPELFWGLVASMYIGNVLLLVLNLPLVPLFAQILRLPYYVLYPLILGISVVGVYSVNNSLFDVWLMGLFGLLGYLMRKLNFPAAALILGMVLGDALERALRQSLMMSQGDLSILIARPISGTLLFLAVLILCLPALRHVRYWRIEAIEREG